MCNFNFFFLNINNLKNKNWCVTKFVLIYFKCFRTNGVKRVGDSPTEGSSPPPEKKIKRRDIAQESSLSPPNFMMNLNVGFTVLLHAFQFLKVHELLRASCVSKAFEMIAHHESLVCIFVILLI